MAIFVISCSFFSYFTAQAKEYEDPPGLLEKTEFLLREWVNIFFSFFTKNNSLYQKCQHQYLFIFIIFAGQCLPFSRCW